MLRDEFTFMSIARRVITAWKFYTAYNLLGPERKLYSWRIMVLSNKYDCQKLDSGTWKASLKCLSLFKYS